MKNILYIALGGSLGSVLRYLVTVFYKNTVVVYSVPIGTLTVNMAGAFIMGIFFQIMKFYSVSNEFRLFLAVGFLGALTTFSTYSMETAELINKKEYISFIFNILLNNIFCISMIFFGAFTFDLCRKLFI